MNTKARFNMLAGRIVGSRTNAKSLCRYLKLAERLGYFDKKQKV